MDMLQAFLTNLQGMDLAKLGAVAVALIAIWESFLRRNITLWLTRFRKPLSWGWKRFVKRPTFRLQNAIYRRRHGERIAGVVLATFDDYVALNERDRMLVRRLRLWDAICIMTDPESSSQYGRFWHDAREKVDKAALENLVVTKSGRRLECVNCAFFKVSLIGEDIHRRDPFTGVCHRTLTIRETDPDSICAHHSALQGFEPSKDGIYNIAPVD